MNESSTDWWSLTRLTVDFLIFQLQLLWVKMTGLLEGMSVAKTQCPTRCLSSLGTTSAGVFFCQMSGCCLLLTAKQSKKLISFELLVKMMDSYYVWSFQEFLWLPGPMLKYGWGSMISGSLRGPNSTLCQPSSFATRTITPEHRTAISCWSSWVDLPLWTATCAPLHSLQSVPGTERCARSLDGGVSGPAMRAVS